ncbi:MAG: DUF4251 domain-containing protein [Rikenellaceae bacterium]
MKKILSIILIMICVVSYGVISTRKPPVSPKEESREQREQRRAARQAAFEKTNDSLVMSRNFQFTPTTMQQITGQTKTLMNPNFEVGIWDGPVDVFLPYIKGYVPPYHYVTLNYTLPSVNKYIAEQTENGWRVSFETSLFSASTYTFIMEINSKWGGATLTIKNPWYNDVQYSGTISQY